MIRPIAYTLSIMLGIVLTTLAQQPTSPKVGLTLSGGGAKGLAHIGILKALDSAGVKVDFVTGTSMGSIVGSLYAIGYSGKEIEEIARNIDWKLILSNQIDLRAVSMEEKEEYGKYTLEIPFEDWKFRVPTGALESQELWLKLSELYFPVYAIKDFDNFHRPFRAVATDVATGEPIVLDQGELITAIRASMAIPGLFTAIEINGKRLVDGGVVRNLPVTEAKQMGADFIIASNVSEGMKVKENLTNPIQILSQIAFFKESEDNKKQVAMSDLYINHPLDPFSTGSFDKAQAIIDSGIVLGNRLYPRFKQLADSLNALRGSPTGPTWSGFRPDSVFIVSSKAEGLDLETNKAFLKGLNFENERWYTAPQISNLIRRSFGNLNYERIRYRFYPVGELKANITFSVKESPATRVKLAIHQNTFSGLSLIANMTTRNFVPNSRSYITLNLGENRRIRMEHLQFLGRPKKIALVTRIQSENFEVTRYDQFKASGLYKLNNFRWDGKIQSGSQRKINFGVGTRYEQVQRTQAIQSAVGVEGKNRFFTTFGFIRANTLDNNEYPEGGIRMTFELGRIYAQDQTIQLYNAGIEVPTPPHLLPSEKDFTQGYLHAEWFRPISSSLTFLGMFQAGFTFGQRQNIFNAFYIGGINRLYRNQIVFPGLPDYSTQANNVAAIQVGLRRKLSGSLYLMARSNLLIHDYIPLETNVLEKKWISGHALTLAYNSLVGPVELSVQYSEKTKTLEPYINLGFSF